MKLRVLAIPVLVLVSAVPALSADRRTRQTSREEAVAALRRFDDAVRDATHEARLAALAVLGKVAHEMVADRMLSVLRRERDHRIRRRVIDLLGAQKGSAGAIGPKLVTLVRRDARALGKRRLGLRLDPVTREILGDRKRAERVLAEKRGRDAVTAAALRTLRRLEFDRGLGVEPLVPLLDSGDDDLVCEVLELCTRQKSRRVLPELNRLFGFYSAKKRWEHGALAAVEGPDLWEPWCLDYGDPDRMRCRPKVHAAVMAAIRATTGRNFSTPVELEHHLQDRAEEKASSGDRAAAAKTVRLEVSADDPQAVKKLLKILSASKEPDLRIAAMQALSDRRPEAARIGRAVAAVLTREAKRKRALPSRLRLDKISGEPLLDHPQSVAYLKELRTCERLACAALKCLAALEVRKGIDPRLTAVLLTSGNDDLVVAVLETIVRCEGWAALPQVLALYRMYPKESGWDLTHIRIRAFNDTWAKVRFYSTYGDPELLRPRPRVVKAIRRTVKEVTGEDCADPREMEWLLKRKDVKAKMKAGRRG